MIVLIWRQDITFFRYKCLKLSMERLVHYKQITIVRRQMRQYRWQLACGGSESEVLRFGMDICLCLCLFIGDTSRKVHQYWLDLSLTLNPWGQVEVIPTLSLEIMALFKIITSAHPDKQLLTYQVKPIISKHIYTGNPW